MSRTKTEKRFDCVAFKRQAQAAIYEMIKDLPAEEQIRAYRQRALSGPLGAWWRKISEPSMPPARNAQRD
jgi:hypothetical protein